jgi:hypothetical protein
MAKGWKHLRTAALAAIAIVAWAEPGAGQVIKSAAGTIGLRAVVPESVTLSLSANSVNFTLLPGRPTNSGSSSVTATTNWSFATGRFVTLYAYFSSSTAALTDGAGHNIPSSAFQISDNGGGFQALVNTVPFGGANAGLSLGRNRAANNNRQGTRTDVMNFNINLSGGTLPQLPAATYTGTLTLQVQAQ